ncbi:hypothetical protein GOB93_18650 [Acetobacter musti]|uniref:Uncharacterized protein n=1 Tax=Acetobacter musti TaxID=864732 RepID=A0ABX0JVT4_9PROT|nr:hypothetical protein [Acetobacter musti]NHN86631.1 hypothetical protein [Acetobacter musti]
MMTRYVLPAFVDVMSNCAEAVWGVVFCDECDAAGVTRTRLRARLAGTIRWRAVRRGWAGSRAAGRVSLMGGLSLKSASVVAI